VRLEADAERRIQTLQRQLQAERGQGGDQ
jgi:hypothetical protein